MRTWWILLFLIVAVPSLCEAQEGPFIGIRAGYNVLSFDDTDYSSTEEKGAGPVLGVEFGYVFNPVITLFVSVNGASLHGGDSFIGNALVGGRARFLERPFSPYAEIVAGGALFQYRSEIEDPLYSGQQVGMGLGFDFMMGQHIGLNIGARAQRFWISKRRFKGTVSDLTTVKTVQLQPSAGLSFYF